MPSGTPEQETFERRLHRVMAALRPPGAIDEAFHDVDQLDPELLTKTGGPEAYVDRFQRMFDLRDADPTDPRVDELAADMCAVMQVVLADRVATVADETSAPEQVSESELQQWIAGLQAAVLALPPAVGRVWELVFTDMFATVSQRPSATTSAISFES